MVAITNFLGVFSSLLSLQATKKKKTKKYNNYRSIVFHCLIIFLVIFLFSDSNTRRYVPEGCFLIEIVLE